MKKNILLLLLMLCMTVGHAFAQDTLYVMKNGVVTQKLVVGKDVDRITFKAPQPVQTNTANVNGQEIVLNSALLYSDGGTTYICLSLNSATLLIVSGHCGQNRPECDFSCSNRLFAIS